jgi:hypothetical protein
MFKTILTYLGLRQAKKRGLPAHSGFLAAAPLLLSAAGFAWANRERIKGAFKNIRAKRLALAENAE